MFPSTECFAGQRHIGCRYGQAVSSAAPGADGFSSVTDPNVFSLLNLKDHSRPYLPTVSNPRAGNGQCPGQDLSAPGTAFLKELCTTARTLARRAWNQGIGGKPNIK